MGRPGATRFIAAAAMVSSSSTTSRTCVPQMIPKKGEDNGEFIDDDTLLMWPEDCIDVLRARHRDRRDSTRSSTSSRRAPGRAVGRPEDRSHAARRADRARPSARSSWSRRATATRKGVRQRRPDASRGSSRTGFSSRTTTIRACCTPSTTSSSRAREGRRGRAVADAARQRSLRRARPLRASSCAATLAAARSSASTSTSTRTRSSAPIATGHVLIVTGTHLLVWDVPRAPVRGAAARGADRPSAVSGGLFVILDNNATTWSTRLRRRCHEIVPSSQTVPTIGGDGTWIASAGSGGADHHRRATVAVEVDPARGLHDVDDPTRELADETPAGPGRVAVPRRVRPRRGQGRLSRTWLDERTNAFENADGFVSWPWLRP